MKYQELKKFDLNSIKSQDEATKWKDTVMTSEKHDILMYINFLRWQQFNKADIRYMNRIVQFLSFDELIDFERENSDLVTGDTEDLVLLTESPKEEKLINPVYIDGKEYSVKSILEDDFESVMIVADREGVLHKFGFIVLSRLQGLELYAYELFEESQEYYKQIIDAKVGTKINVYCDIVGENQVTKTFKKSDLLIENKSFILASKSNKGVMSPVTKEGTYSILKKEDVLSANGISEDRLQNQISKFQQEIADKLGFKKSDIVDATEKMKEQKAEKTSEDFADEFKFAEKYKFSVVSPDIDEEYSHINPLTHSILEFLNQDGSLNEEYVDEVYELIYKRFGIAEEKEGYWAIENIKLDRVVRKLVNSGAIVEINKENVSDFLKRFTTQNYERIMNPVMKLQIIKKIQTKKDIAEFAKDSGTELYVQIGQVMTAVLEGAQRLYGENHMVFDSDHKLIICKYDNLDLREASEYAIENGYQNFYVIEKDKFLSYDAWYKETLKNKVDETETTPIPNPSINNTTLSNFTPVVNEKWYFQFETSEQGKSVNIVSETDHKAGFTATQDIPDDIQNKISSVLTELLEGIYEPLDDDDTVRNTLIGFGFEELPEKVSNDDEENLILFDAKEPTDIVLVGDQVKDTYDFSITDDESDYKISADNKTLVKYASCGGFVSVLSVQDFMKHYKTIGSGDWSISDIFESGGPCDFYVIKNYTGKVRLKVKLNDGTYFPTAKLNLGIDDDYIQHNREIKKANNGDYVEIFVDFEGNVNPIQMDEKLFNELKLNVERESKLNRVVGETSKTKSKFDDDFEDEDFDEDQFVDDSILNCGGEEINLDEASEEIEQEFEENCGYEIGDDFIFAIYEETTATNTIGDAKFIFSINPLSYWNKCGYQYDQHLEYFLRKKFPVLNSVGFEELAETTFDFYNDNGHFNLSETIDTLCKAGIKFKIDFQNQLSSKDTTQVVNMINQLGHQNCII